MSEYGALLSEWLDSEHYRRHTTAVPVVGTGGPGGGDFVPDALPIGAKQHRVVQQEVRVTDPDTGGQKGQKVERFDLIPVEPLREVARVYGVGARKYADRNWEKGYKWSLSYAALMRHITAFWGGETYDTETGLHHAAHAVFHCLALIEYETTHQEKDDRPTSCYVEQNEASLNELLQPYKRSVERRVGVEDRRIYTDREKAADRTGCGGERGTVSAGGRRDGECY